MNLDLPAVPDRETCVGLLDELLEELGTWTEEQRRQPSIEMTLRYWTIRTWLETGEPLTAQDESSLLQDGPSIAAHVCTQILFTLALTRVEVLA